MGEKDTLYIVNKETIFNIPEEQVPIIILFGPPACGKTMTLSRLCRYLIGIGYSVKPCTSFRDDEYYHKLCERFTDSLFDDIAKPGSRIGDSILIEIRDKNGKLIKYIFDTAGECYFDPRDFYLTTFKPVSFHCILQLFLSPNPKRWCFFVEPNYRDIQVREYYVKGLEYIQSHFIIPKKDKSIIIYNKIDKTPFLISPTNVDHGAVCNSIKSQYPGLLNLFQKHSLIYRLLVMPLGIGCIKIISFMTGYFCSFRDNRGDEYMKYNIGRDCYPKQLWNSIDK